MATRPPTTPDSSLNAFLVWVFNQIEILSTGAKPEDGWALTDFQPDVSEVISDKRDLIDIVTKWDESAANLVGWEDLTNRQYQTIEQLRVDVTNLTDHGALFEETLMWWDANRKIIHDVKVYAETIDENLEEVIALAGNVNQTRDHIDSQRQAADLAASNASNAADTSENNAEKTAADRSATEASLAEAQLAETGAKTARDDTLAAEGRVELAEARTVGYRDEAGHLRDLVLQDKDAVGQMRTDSEGFALRAEAGAATVGDAEVVLEARERAVLAQSSAESSAATASSKADIATAKATEAGISSTSAQGAATTATEKANQTANDRIATGDDRVAVSQARTETLSARDDAASASTTATTKAVEAKADADRSKAEADRAEVAADGVDSAAMNAAIAAVNDRVNQLLQDAPEAFDTLKEISDKLIDQDDAISSLIAQIAVAAQKAAWDQISGKPTSYPPSVHEHTTSQVTGLDSAITEATQNKATINQMNQRPATFSGTGPPPASIPGSVAGDIWIDRANPDELKFYKITGV